MIRSPRFYAGVALGAALMYLLDPDQGSARRAVLRDRVSGSLHEGGTFLGKAARDLRNRADGAIAQSVARVRPDHPDDEILGERVRAKLGRYVSHPQAIAVSALEGCVTLSGPILRNEVEELIGAVSSVRGVREVLNRLEPHDRGDAIASLPGGRHLSVGSRLPIRMTPGLQLIAGVLGAGAVAYGAGRIAARVREARREELESEMPEYAMLR